MTGQEFLGALIVGIVPSLLWLAFWLREDEASPEPRSLLAGCFLVGMLAVLIAIPAEQAVAHFIANDQLKYTVWAAIEELLKFIAVAAVALHARSYDEPIDSMIYLIAVALGFAALENTLFVMGPFSHGDLAASIIHGNLRSIGASLVHVVSSSAIGFGLGLTFYRGMGTKVLVWILAFAAAVAVHSVFNISIVNAGASDTLRAFGWIWGAVVIMIVLFEEVKGVRPKLVART